MSTPRSLMKPDIRRHHLLFILGAILIALGLWFSLAKSGIGKAPVAQAPKPPQTDAAAKEKPEPRPVVLATAIQPFIVQAKENAEEKPGEERASKPTENAAPAPSAKPPEAKAQAQAEPKQPPEKREPKGEVKEGERLPALAIEELDRATLDKLMRHNAARLIAQVRRDQGTLVLLIPAGTGSLADLGQIRPLDKEEAAGLSTRNFPFPVDRPPISTERLDYKVRQWLTEKGIGDAEARILYELRLTADFDRRLARLQRETLDRRGIKASDPRYTSAKTRLRLEEDAKGLIPRISLE